MDQPITLFNGHLGTQRVRVWLERRPGGIALLSSDNGPALEHAFGTDWIETCLQVDAEQLPQLATALGTDPSTEAVLRALADRYHGDSAATTSLRTLLDEQKITYRFAVV